MHLLQYSAGVIFIWSLIAEVQGSRQGSKLVTVHPQKKVTNEGCGEAVLTLMTALLDQHPYSAGQDLFNNVSFAL